MRQITLVEYQTKPAVLLSLEERDLLRHISPGIAMSPTPGSSEHYDLTPDSRIGAISLQNLAIEIRPKIQKLERVLFLMGYAINPENWKENDFEFGEAYRIHEALVPGFVSHIRRAFRRGVLQGYRSKDDSLPTIRGRIRFDDQIRYRYGVAPPAEVSYDEFTEDIEINRLIKAAIARLERLRFRNPKSRAQLRAFRASLERVQRTEYNPRQLPQIPYDRLNGHYRPAVELAKLILKSAAFELAHGTTLASAFLVDMNKVFEDFVVVALREAFNLTPKTFPQNAKGRALRLDHAGHIHLEPDISWWDGNRCTFVGDVKYKRVSVSGINHPDLYQLLSYVIAADLPTGLLIYAAGEGESTIHEVIHLGRRLEVVSIDLSGEPEQILSQVAQVAALIRDMRNESIHLVA